MKSMHKLAKLSLSFLMIVMMMIFSLSLLSSAASDKLYPIIEDKHDELDYSETFSHSFTLNYNSQVRIYFQGYNSSHRTYGKYVVEIKNSANEVVYTVTDQSSYGNKEHLTDELPRGDYTLNIRCNSTSSYDDFEFCLNLSYKVLEDVSKKI